MSRILLKLSGEALAGDKHHGFDEATVIEVAKQVKQIVDNGTPVSYTHLDVYKRQLLFLIAKLLTFMMISVTSSLTPEMELNSCRTCLLYTSTRIFGLTAPVLFLKITARRWN